MTNAQYFNSQKWKIYPQSILNGVIGDYLSSKNNALSLPMSLFSIDSSEVIVENNQLLNANQLEQFNHKKKIVLFIHGAADNELCWYRTNDTDSVNIAYNLRDDYEMAPILLRYNSGLSILENAEKLSAIIKTFMGQLSEDKELYIVAHSMGGLIFRQTLGLAISSHENWTRTLNKIIYLGSPHHGAPLEDFGKLTTGILNILPNPYTKLIAKIINLRSEGIKDLGSKIKNTETHNNELFNSKEYFIAATVFKDKDNVMSRYLGDIMVPIESAKNGLHDLSENVFLITDTSHPKLTVSKKAYRIIENIINNSNNE